jgi:hypothetical protein
MWASPRYHVATVSGDLEPRKGGTSAAMGLSAHVIDRPNAARVVATFRSEERLNEFNARGQIVRSPSRGQEGAIAAAQALADEWNADEAE